MRTLTPRSSLFVSLTLFVAGLLSSHFSFAQAPTWTWAETVVPWDTVSYLRGSLSSVISDNQGGAYVAGSFYRPTTFGTTTLTSDGNQDAFVGHLDSTNHWTWVQKIGGTDLQTVYSMVLAPNGNVFLNGWCAGTTTLGSFTVGGDGYVACISPAGQWQWVTELVGSSTPTLAVDGVGNVFVAGSYSFNSFQVNGVPQSLPERQGLFFTQLSANTGQHIRSVLAGQPAQTGSTTVLPPLRLAIGATGEVFFSGTYYQRLTWGGTQLPTPNTTSQWDGFLGCYVPGTQQWRWVKSLNSTGGRVRYGNNIVNLTTDAQGQLYAAGNFLGTINLSGTPLTSAPGTIEGYITSLNPLTGTDQWVIHGNFGVRDMKFAAGRLYTSGFFDDTLTVGASTVIATTMSSLIACYTASTGAGQWAKALSTTGHGFSTGLAVLNANDLLISGGFEQNPLPLDALTLSLPPTAPGAWFLARLTNITNGLPEDAANAAFSLAPNPAHATARLSGGTGPAEVVDALGRTVYTSHLAPGTSNLDLDLTGLRPGLYLVRRGGATRRLVVE